MKIISKKNYVVLIVLLVVTVLITLYLSNVYSNKNRETSNIYKYFDSITYKDFDVYITENPDIILYIGDKYDVSYDDFNEKLISRIEKYDLKDRFVYMNVNSKIINKINQKYKVKLNINSIPYIIAFLDGKIVKYSEINIDSQVNNIVNLLEFE